LLNENAGIDPGPPPRMTEMTLVPSQGEPILASSLLFPIRCREPFGCAGVPEWSGSGCAR
jgi:hypothetical protein